LHKPPPIAAGEYLSEVVTRFAAKSRNNRARMIVGVTAPASASAFASATASAMASAMASALAAQVFCRKGRLDQAQVSEPDGQGYRALAWR
jgi:hypothetical protein